MISRKRLLPFAIATSFVLLGIWQFEAIAVSINAALTPKSTLDERINLIEGFIDIRLPPNTEEPVPAVLQFHGCAGARTPFQDQWADIAIANGYAAVIVDSNRPRGLSRADALETVCAGKRLFGQERAGDILAALEVIKREPAIDPERLVFTGWSHGAWAIMDYMTMDFATHGPAGMAQWQRERVEPHGLILFYPYCGPGTLSRLRRWREETPTLALIAGADTVVSAEQCIKFFERKSETALTVYPGAEHAFDDPFIEPEWIHWHNPDAFEDAKKQFAGFLIQRGSAGQ